MGTAAVLAYAGSHALDAELARVVAHAGIDPHGLAFVASLVVQVAGGECALGIETVLALLHRRLVAGDDSALEVGIALDADLEAAVPCLYAALLGNALVVAVDLALAGIQSAANGHACGADGEAAAHRLVAAGIAAAVLQAFEFEIATHFGHHLFAADHGPLERGVAARLEGDAVACGYMGVVVADVIAVGMAFSLANAGGDAGVRANGHTNAAAGAAVGAAVAMGVSRSQQIDLVVCDRRDVIARSAFIRLELLHLTGIHAVQRYH